MTGWKRTILAAVLALGMLGADAAEPAASRQAVEKPFKTVVTKLDASKLAGTVIAYDGGGFDLQNDRKETIAVNWTDLDARSVFTVHARILEKAPAEPWISLGTMLLAMEDGGEWADKAFARAARIDPSLKERIEQIKAGAAQRKTDEQGPAAGQEEEAAGNEMGGKVSGPEVIGPVEEKYWGKLTDEEMAEAVRTLKAFGDQTQSTMNIRLQLHETEFFLFYSDLQPQEARHWAGLLDKMYVRLCNLFAIDETLNIWRGKALIFVFHDVEDYRRFQRTMHNTDPIWSAGMCHTYGDGTVHIAFYRKSNALRFARVLVHEAVHGFLHRYRKPVHIPSWVNEGLADTIEQELVPMPGTERNAMTRARQGMSQYGGLTAEFFRTGRIEPWQYPVAQTLTEFMIVNNKKGYVAFINGIKDGLTWEESMKTHYGADPERVVRAYLDWMKAPPRRN